MTVSLPSNRKSRMSRPQSCCEWTRTGPWGADCKEAAALAIRKAQKDVAATPEFAGTVKFVETHDFVRAEEVSSTGKGYHEFNNARRTS